MDELHLSEQQWTGVKQTPSCSASESQRRTEQPATEEPRQLSPTHRHGVVAFLLLASPTLSRRGIRRSCYRKMYSWPNATMTTRTCALVLLFLLLVTAVLLVVYDSKTDQYLRVFADLFEETGHVEPGIHHKLTTAPPQLATTTPFPTDRSSLGHPFNPDTFDNRSVNPNRKITILYWSKIRGFKARMQRRSEYDRDPHVWPFTYAGDECPVPCELTNDRRKADKASAFVIHSRITDVWDFPPFEYLAPWILQNNENPVYTPALYDSRIMSKFNLLISYRLDSDFPSPIYPKPSRDEPMQFRKRLGLVLAVFSKCEAVRTEYMRQLMQFIQVDSYGACLKNKEGLIGLYGQINGKYVFKDYKMVLTRYYKFSLVFMNQDCDFFVDDRLYHALDAGSIPVYMGTDKIDQFLPGRLRHSIIKVSDFKSPQALAEYLRYLSTNETAFNEYLAWKRIGIGEISNTTIGRWWNQRYPLFCQVCMRLSQGGLHQGLARDYCKARTYEDWGIQPPYPSNSKSPSEMHTVVQSGLARVPYAILGVVISGLVLSFHGLKYAFCIIKAFRGIL